MQGIARVQKENGLNTFRLPDFQKLNVVFVHVSSPEKNRERFKKLQGGDLNPRPPGYEPDELPGCSTLRQES